MFLSVEDIKTLESNKFISEEDYYRDYSSASPKYGDILMTRIGDIGTPNIVTSNEKLAYYVTLALIKSKKLDSQFLKANIQSNVTQHEL